MTAKTKYRWLVSSVVFVVVQDPQVSDEFGVGIINDLRSVMNLASG